MINDRVDGNRRFTGLSVTNDQFTLTAANGYHRINRLDTCLQGFLHRFTKNHTRGFPFQRHFKTFPRYRSFTIDGFTQCIDYTTNHSFTNFNGSDLAGAFHFRTFLDSAGLSHQYYTHIIFLKVQCNSTNATFKFHQFTITNIAQPIHTGNAITYLQNGTYFLEVSRHINVAQLLTQNRTYFVRFNISHIFLFIVFFIANDEWLVVSEVRAESHSLLTVHYLIL